MPLGALSLELPEEETHEACRFTAPPAPQARGPARNATEAAVIVSLAGDQAESLARAGTGHASHSCSDVARLLTDGDPREAEPYLEWLRLKAYRLVEHPLRQRVIRAVALALAERGALAPGDVEAVERLETGRYMRGQ